MDGKTNSSLLGALAGVVAWLVVVLVGAYYVQMWVDYRFLLAAVIITGCLFVFMIIDIIMDFSYYGKIASYKNSVSQLQSRVRVGKNSIKSNHDAFMASQNTGWEFDITAAPSIPEEARSIEATVTSMESLKKGFTSGAKNVSFFLTAIAVTVVGCMALFPYGESIVMSIVDESIEYNTLFYINVIALVVTCIIEFLFAKYLWSKTDCNVTSKTLLALPLGPVAYLALVALGSLLVMLVVNIIAILVGLVAVVIAGACVFGVMCGG